MRRVLQPRRQLLLPRTYSKPQYPIIDQTHPLSRGMTGCWPMGEQVNANIIGFPFQDIAQGHHATTKWDTTNSDSFVSVASHHGGTAASTNVLYHYFDTGVGVQTLWGSASGTMCGWLKPGAAFNSGVNERLADSNSFLFAVHYTDNNLYFGMDVGGGGRVSFAATSTNWPQGVWAFYACTWVNGGSTIAYVNGAQAGSNTGTSQGTSSTLRFRYGYSLGIGVATSTLDMIRIYNRALSAAEILWLYAEPYAGIYSSFAIIGGLADILMGQAVM